jgi:cytosine/adenosine deaminase-related metal-dependent hydrolase
VGTLDVLDDVRLLRQTFPELKLETLLRMATLGGAEALGFADLGSLEPGKRAVLVHAKAAAAVADPLEHIVSSETRLERVAVAA